MTATETKPLMAGEIAALPRRVRARRALTALAKIVRDPEQTDQVLEFSAYMNAGTSARRVARFYEQPAAQDLFLERRAIDSRTVDLDVLAALPPGTLGHEYARFLRSRGFTPDVFAIDEAVPDRASYVAQRFRQTHDLWHVLTGFSTDAASEVALQAFTYGQTGAPSTGIIAAIGTLRAAVAGYRIGGATLAAYRNGRAASYLGAFPWEEHWATPIAELRALLGITPVEMPAMPARVAEKLAELQAAKPAA
jgi:ubiquinone biosynthesis protein COQ4